MHMHLILCRLIWSDGTCLRVPSSQTLCEYHQPRSEIGFYYTATQWALTFPNLRRHHHNMFCVRQHLQC